MKELNFGLEQGISYCLESDNPVSARKRYSFLFLKLSSVLGLNDKYNSCIQNVALKQWETITLIWHYARLY